MNFKIYNSNAAGELVSLKTERTTTVTNSTIGHLSTLHGYLSVEGQRMQYIDNYKIELEGGSTVIGEGMPVVTTADVSAITNTTATAGGNVTDENGTTVTHLGVCWSSTNTEPTLADSCTDDGTGAGPFTSSLTGLTLSTTYHVRAYATNTTGTSYGAGKDFTTSPYTVTYNGNISSDGSVPVDASSPYISGTSVTVLGNTGNLVKDGYTFNGWNTAADGSGDTYAADDTFLMGSNNVTLYAQWTLSTYTVTYDGNDATSGTAPDAQTKTQGIDLTLATNSGVLAKTGFTFAGWNTATNRTGTDYAVGATSGTAPDAQTKTQGVDLTLATNSGALAKTGLTFAGWNTAADGTGTDYAVGATYSTDAALTLYAKWTALPTYTVTYDSNGSTSGTAPDAQTKTQGVDLTLATNSGALAKTGFTFAGWNTAINGTGTDYAVGATYSTDATLTLYAKWTALPTYTATYNGNGNTGGSVPVDAISPYLSDATVTVLGNTGSLVKTGYTFNGWNTAADGGGASYAPAATFAMGSSNVILYAQWTANDYTVTYNGNTNTGGSVPTDGNTYNITATVTVLGNTGTLVETGYTFAGWNTNAIGSGTSYSGGDTFAMDSGNIILYAQWTANDYTVTYNGNGNTGGTVPTDSTTYHTTDLVTVLGNTGTLVKTGYTFAGWNTAANGSGTSYSEGDTFVIGSNDVTLYSQWAIIKPSKSKIYLYLPII